MGAGLPVRTAAGDQKKLVAVFALSCRSREAHACTDVLARLTHTLDCSTNRFIGTCGFEWRQSSTEHGSFSRLLATRTRCVEKIFFWDHTGLLLMKTLHFLWCTTEKSVTGKSTGSSCLQKTAQQPSCVSLHYRYDYHFYHRWRLANSKSVFGVHFVERSNHQFALFSAIEGLQDAVLLSWDSLTPSQIVDARTFLLEYASARLSSNNYQEVFLLVNKAAHAIAVISKRGWVDAVSLEVRWSCAFQNSMHNGVVTCLNRKRQHRPSSLVAFWSSLTCSSLPSPWNRFAARYC
jgi:hypothetical protein